MESGKIDYSPDYKSEASRAELHAAARGAMGAAIQTLAEEANDADAESSRLEREVIEASIAKRIADKTFAAAPNKETWNEGVQANNKFMETVDRLIEFESKQ